LAQYQFGVYKLTTTVQTTYFTFSANYISFTCFVHQVYYGSKKFLFWEHSYDSASHTRKPS